MSSEAVSSNSNPAGLGQLAKVRVGDHHNIVAVPLQLEPEPEKRMYVAVTAKGKQGGPSCG
jgi:hypothetical protein